MLRGPQLPYAIRFQVSPRAEDRVGVLRLASGPDSDLPHSYRVGSPNLVLVNDHSAEILVRIERSAAREDALTAAQACSLALFRELFPMELLEADQLISVAQVTFLTTELRDVGDLYRTLGDEAAGFIVHEHFRLFEERVRREGGALVKTFGEGILAAFHDSSAALRVALDLQPILAANPSTASLSARVGGHRGPAMIATLNGKLDYLGSTVNRVVALPQSASWGGVAISQEMAASTDFDRIVTGRDQNRCSVVRMTDRDLHLAEIEDERAFVITPVV